MCMGLMKDRHGKRHIILLWTCSLLRTDYNAFIPRSCVISEEILL